MFGVQRLKDEIEGLQEERNYFRSKFLEQVSEIASLKEALKQSEREVSRLRREVMAVASPELLRSRQKVDEEKKEDTDMMHVMSSLSVDDDDDDDSVDEDEDEQAAIRIKAEQLVRWASYRQEVLSPERSSFVEEGDSDDEADEEGHDNVNENDDEHERGDEKPFDQKHDEKAHDDTEHETDEEGG